MVAQGNALGVRVLYGTSPAGAISLPRRPGVAPLQGFGYMLASDTKGVALVITHILRVDESVPMLVSHRSWPGFLAPGAGRLLIATRRKPVDCRSLWSRAPGAGRLTVSFAPLRGLSP